MKNVFNVMIIAVFVVFLITVGMFLGEASANIKFERRIDQIVYCIGGNKQHCGSTKEQTRVILRKALKGQ